MQSSCDLALENADLVTQILLRLPVKDVLRCKSVCKKWLSLISDPKFCYSHTLRLCRQNPNPHALLFPKLEDHHNRGSINAHIVPFTSSDDDAEQSSPVRIIPLFYFENGFRVSAFFVMQSCNGLLLCCDSSRNGPQLPLSDRFIVWNLATGKNVDLSLPRGKRYLNSFVPYIAFEPLRSPHYKIIVFDDVFGSAGYFERSFAATTINETFEPTIRVGVYLSETNSWSEVRVCYSALPDDMFSEIGVYCNGAIHWYTLGKDLVYFDVDRLCFNKLFGPAFADSDDACVKYFGESIGRLHLILANSDRCLDFDIWELKEDYSGWIVRYHVDLNRMGEGGAILWHGNPSFAVLRVVRQANEEHSMLVLFADSKVMSYNLKGHTSRIIHEVEKVLFRPFQYFDTLSCVGLDYRRLE